ncbi:MAG: class I SAM-dependent methyltransferase [Bacteroidetes bacterium]|nr:class I SAM-dependent methyltransferase [Bacteroidota bacterium]NOG57346.1 class I SAM-dependent methyltransferase [Bacteroidota bacterium]
MAFEFHKDKDTYIKYQQENAENYVIPFIEEKFPLKAGMYVMEIGCAEGGVLKAFLKRGCIGTGVELSESRTKRAELVLADEIAAGQAKLVNKNIYDVDIEIEMPHRFDLIVLKDVIEHIHDQDKVLEKLREFLKPNGQIFFGFPPWQMPFGGHQQIASKKWLSILPYYHLLPMSLFKGFLKLFGENKKTIDELVEIKETGISIERFEKLIKKNSYSISNRTYYLINPIYKYKFNLEPRKQLGLISSIPYLRNFLTTCMYYLVKKEEI